MRNPEDDGRKGSDERGERRVDLVRRPNLASVFSERIQGPIKGTDEADGDEEEDVGIDDRVLEEPSKTESAIERRQFCQRRQLTWKKAGRVQS